MKPIRNGARSLGGNSGRARYISDTALARLWLAEGSPTADVLTMLEVRRRFEFSPQLARAYAVEILSAAKASIQPKSNIQSFLERSSMVPLLEIVQTRQVSATIRLDESIAGQIDQYADFLHASPDEVIDKALAYVFAKDRDFQEFLRTPEPSRAAQSLRVRRSQQNGGTPEPVAQPAEPGKAVETDSDSPPRS